MVDGVTEKVIARAKAVKILKKIPVFNGLLEDEYFRVLSMCSSKAIKKGEVIFNEGDDGDSTYILLSGGIDIIVEGKGIVHSMQGGEILGEIGLVTKSSRTASAVANTDSVMLQLYAEILHEVVKKRPRIGYIIMLNIAKILADRLKATNAS
jgi:CRP-like cAMP-binding protein